MNDFVYFRPKGWFITFFPDLHKKLKIIRSYLRVQGGNEMFNEDDNDKDEGISLKVAEALQGDVGKGIVRMDREAQNKIGVSEMDVVEIQGNKKTGAVVANPHPNDQGLEIVRMDQYIRKNSGASIGENVKMRKTEAKEAKKIRIAPAERNVNIRISPDLVKRNLIGRALSRGDFFTLSGSGQGSSGTTGRSDQARSPFEEMFKDIFDQMNVSVPFALGELKFVVTSTSPSGIVRISKSTEIEVSRKSVESVEKEKIPEVSYEDIGGLDEEISKIREMVELPLKHPELFDRIGIEPPKGVLLHGPPGTGKTLMAKAVANESDAYFKTLNGPEIMSKYYGQSEEKLRNIFEEAEENAPAIIFIDEIDAIAPKRDEATGEVEKRVVSQLLSLMDGLETRGKVMVIAATNRVNSLDPALRRGGRFDREIEIGIPDRESRKEILQIHTRGMPRAEDVDLNELADTTYGFVGADINTLAKEAAMNALRRIIPELDLSEEEIPSNVLKDLVVTKDDFMKAYRSIEPSALREVALEIPKVTWDEVGGLSDVKQRLKEAIQWPLEMPERFQDFGIEPPKGILLYGPPGTGKTLMAKAVANESDANFISIKGPEVLSKWVGESEKAIREVFRKARQAAPTIIFLDELDSIAPSRGRSGGDSNVTDRIVNQLLTEMDGIEEMENVVVIGGTNRPDIVDPALVRPGRFDRAMLVPAPDEEARRSILKIHTRDVPISENVDLNEIAEETQGFVGADLEYLVREAAMNSIRENSDLDEVRMDHFEKAMKEVSPSVDEEVNRRYKEFAEKFKKKSGTQDFEEQGAEFR